MNSTLFAYAFFNFAFTSFVLQEGGIASVIKGKKVIHNHGNIIRELTDEEYETQQAYAVRSVSGHWMLFYAAGMIMLYPKKKEEGEPAFSEANL